MLGAHPSQESRELRAREAPGAGGSDTAVVLVVPLAPQTGGNGLAMRAGMLLEALAGQFPVDLVVVPVSGPGSELAWAGRLARSVQVVGPLDAAAARRHVTLQLADATLRRRLEATAPLPTRAKSAPPTLAGEAYVPLSTRHPRAVFVLRGYLAPLGCTLARRLGAQRIIIDLDDDDEMLARSLGDQAEADATARLARAWLPEADTVCAAADDEARAIAARYGLASVVTLPNAVRVPDRPAGPPPGGARLLFVGNLTYWPNLEAARILVEEILPLVRLEHPGASIDLVGPHPGDLAERPHVRVAGAVADLEPYYRAADVVVAPLRHGGGTRIKVLEAFAHRRPLVATPLAIAGLAVRDGRELLLGDSPAALARAISGLLADPAAGSQLAEHAAATLAARYVQNVVAPLICHLAAGEQLDGDFLSREQG